MKIPKNLYETIEKLCSQLTLKELQAASSTLSERYRQKESGHDSYIGSQKQRLAYLAARFPATFAAVSKVGLELEKRCGEALLKSPIQSVLDVGAGPATALLALLNIFPTIKKATLIEKDLEMAGLGKKLLAATDSPPSVQWRLEDLKTLEKMDEADLVIFSYSLNEMNEKSQIELLKKAIHAAKKYVIVIEPGTMEGFSSLLLSRDTLLEHGLQMVAPCPHGLKCPMPKEDWCHFSVRLERFLLHKRVKLGELGFEDEKFSYVIVSKIEAFELACARIIRHPQVRAGHIQLSLCTKNEGLIKKTYSKKLGEFYKEIKKCEWGDSLERA